MGALRANDDVAVYTIDPTRAHEVVQRILGSDFKGVLKCDCFLAYDDADLSAIEQSKCLGHLLRRCSDIGDSVTGRAVVFSRQVAKLLRAAIALKKRRDDLSPHGYLVARGRLEAALDRLLQGNYTDPENAKLAKLLRKHRHQLFGFLAIPELDATNNAAERDIRPGVIVRTFGQWLQPLQCWRTHSRNHHQRLSNVYQTRQRLCQSCRRFVA